jgi:hypothetical protein
VIDSNDSLWSVRTNRRDNLFVKNVRVGIVPSRSLGLEPMTQVPTRDESHSAADLIDRIFNTRSESKVILIGQETITECHNLSLPTILQQKVKRDSYAVIEIMLRQS